MAKPKLILIGYWHNIFTPTWPDPAWFVDNNWEDGIKQKVIAHLKNGLQMPHVSMGYSWCRFRCGNNSLGSSELTDGKYVWPEGLVHYLEHHNVKLPTQVVDSFIDSNNSTKNIIGDIEIDSDFWMQQKGWNLTNSTFKDILDVGIITVESSDLSKKQEQEKLLLNFLKESNGIMKKFYSIDKIVNGEKTSIKGRFKDYEQFSNLAIAVGLKTTFKELTHQEYENEQF